MSRSEREGRWWLGGTVRRTVIGNCGWVVTYEIRINKKEINKIKQRL